MRSTATRWNFCKFTNETRNTYEAAGRESGQHYICAIRGSCAGGGYELALACDHIILANDGASSVALPEVPLLAVLPGTGGLTRVTDKRKVRRDRADVFCAMEEGARGQKALDWGLVDEIVPNSRLEEIALARARDFAERVEDDGAKSGITLTPLDRRDGEDGGLIYSTLRLTTERAGGFARIEIRGPDDPAPQSIDALVAQGASAWMLRLARELDDAILHLRFNEPETGRDCFQQPGRSAVGCQSRKPAFAK